MKPSCTFLSIIIGLSLSLTGNINIKAQQFTIAEMITEADKQNFDEVKLETLPPQVTVPGTDPEAIALEAFPPLTEQTEGPPIEETITINEDSPDQTLVTITRINLPDTSVRGIKIVMQFLPEGEINGQKKWRMNWAGRQYTCREGRGSQDWSKQLCL